jgi:hypothetical protein
MSTYRFHSLILLIKITNFASNLKSLWHLGWKHKSWAVAQSDSGCEEDGLEMLRVSWSSGHADHLFAHDGIHQGGFPNVRLTDAANSQYSILEALMIEECRFHLLSLNRNLSLLHFL